MICSSLRALRTAYSNAQLTRIKAATTSTSANVLSRGPRSILADRMRSAIIQTFGLEYESQDPMVVPAGKPEFGDYQCNIAMMLAKKLGTKPQDIAKRLMDNIDTDNILAKDSLSIAGPGFINMKLDEAYIKRKISAIYSDPTRLSIAPYDKPIRIVVDFSSPNIAKEMHVGHLRSTIIGDSISRILEFLGHDTVRINHVGDWGTQFGMLICFLKENHPKYYQACIEAKDDSQAVDSVPIKDLVEFYKAAKKRFDEDKAFEEASRGEVVKLQAGDVQSIRVWKAICHVSRVEFDKIYKMLDIKVEERGESFYNPMLKSVVDELEDRGIAVISEGASCIFLPGYKNSDGTPLPLIVKKTDGGYLYATTDLAAVKHRVNTEKANRVLYVTDIGQAQHFEMVYKAAELASLYDPKIVQLKHVPFGLVQGEDGKKFKSRAGDTVKLKDLLDEAVRIASEDMTKRLNKELSDEEKMAAKTIGIGAVKYADLSMNRESNYRFSYSKMLSLTGNTAPYMLYAYARIQGIRRKAAENLKVSKISGMAGNDVPNPSSLMFSKAEEINLAKSVLKLDDVLKEIEVDLYTNKLCEYLFDLSQKFNQFYENCPVLKAETPEIQLTRTILCSVTADTLRLGLSLLGIDCLEKI